MNKNLLYGWKDVFSFTFKQGVTGNKFKMTTIGIGTALFLAGMAICVLMAWLQKKDATEVSPIEVVHIVDESGLDFLYTEGFLEENKEKYPSLSFVTEDATVEALSKNLVKKTDGEESATGRNDVILHIGRTENGYRMTLYLPQGSDLGKDDGEDFLDQVTMIMEQSKLFSSGIPMEKLVIVMSGVVTTMLDAGEAEKSIGEELVSMLLPVLLVLFLFLMTYLYGQSIGNIVSVEKTSKLMEMILTMTKPYGLIMGKIFSTASIGLLQMAFWIVCVIGGFGAGHIVAKEIVYPEYSNILFDVFELLKNQDGSTAFSTGALVLGLLTVGFGFLFYCVLAGLIASFADKAENLATVMAFHQLFVMVGYFAGILLPLQENNEILIKVARIIPVTSAFVLPGDIVVGNVTVLEGILYTAILVVTTIILVFVTGKIYKNQLFYKGIGLKGRFKNKKKA